jgi:hypothetical protein
MTIRPSADRVALLLMAVTLGAGCADPAPPSGDGQPTAVQAATSSATAQQTALTARRSGVVRLDGRVFADGQGPQFAIGSTFFAAAWAYKHDRTRLVDNLRFLKGGGIDYIRVLGVVGPGGWTDRTVDPAWPDYDAVVAGLTDLAYDEGLRVEWTIFGGVELASTARAREEVVRRFVAMARTRAHKIQHWEVANEAWQNGFEGTAGRNELRTLAGLLREGSPLPVALSAPPDRATATNWYANGPANLLTMHLDRSQQGADGPWRPVYQAWDVASMTGVPAAWTSNEPTGPESSVTADADPLRLAASAAVVAVSGGAGYVLHTGPGVRFGGAEDRERKRSANFADVERIGETLAALRAVKSVLPADVGNWARHEPRTDGSEYPFDPDVVLTDLAAGRVLRAYCASAGPRFVCVPIRLQGQTTWRARRAMQVEVIGLRDGTTQRTVALEAGESLTLEDGGEAVILRGRWR